MASLFSRVKKGKKPVEKVLSHEDRIVTITLVRNEGDVIESLCRYVLTWADQMLIWDDGSTDDTTDIIEKLQEEGLPIVLWQDSQYDHIQYRQRQIIKRNTMVEEAFEKLQATWVMSVDADEFLFSVDGKNPREKLLELDPEKENMIYWQTYLYEDVVLENRTFLPLGFPKRRAESLEHSGKTILSRQMYEKGHRFTIGCHTLSHPKGRVYRKLIDPPKGVDSLKIAHYPLRSEEQLKYKIFTGEMNYFFLKDRQGASYHWKLLYEKLKNKGKLSEEDVRNASLIYVLRENRVVKDEEKEGIYHPISIDFLEEPITLKYTDYENRDQYLVPKILSHFESLAKAALEREEQLKERIKSLQRRK